MNQSINFTACIVLALVLNACSANMGDDEYFGYVFDELLEKWGFTYQNVCPSVTDAVEYPEPWDADAKKTFVIPDETICSMSTCGLLVSCLKDPVYIGNWTMNNLYAPGVSLFNNELRENIMALEFFNRSDFYPVLISKYLSVIKVTELEGSAVVGSAVNGPGYLEWILASDMCLSAMSQNAKVQLMVIALERTKYAVDFEKNQACMIMISIMKSCKYTPFMEDIEPRLIETSSGYAMLEPGVQPRFIVYMGYTMYDHISCGAISNALSIHDRDIIMEFAKQFINKQEL